MGIRETLDKQGFRIFGPPPPKDAPRVETWIYVCRIYRRLLPHWVLLWAIVVLSGAPTWIVILFGISAAGWIVGLISLNLFIRRLRSAPPSS